MSTYVTYPEMVPMNNKLTSKPARIERTFLDKTAASCCLVLSYFVPGVFNQGVDGLTWGQVFTIG